MWDMIKTYHFGVQKCGNNNAKRAWDFLSVKFDFSLVKNSFASQVLSQK